MKEEIKLDSKSAELRIRRFLRHLTNSNKNCRISIENYRSGIYDFPHRVGKPFSYTGRWLTFNGRKQLNMSYVRSTQNIIVGLMAINKIKSLSTKKQKGKYKLLINRRSIELPNLAVGRWVVKNYPDKSKKLEIKRAKI